MSAKLKRRLALIHILPLVLAGIVLFAPKQRSGVAEPWVLLAAMAVIELLFVYFLRRRQRKGTNASGLCDIISFVWLLLIAWEIFTSVTGAAHPVLVPEPENVFDTFREQWDVLALNILYSLQLLVTGFAIGMAAAIVCGLAAGWYGRLRDFVYPIANVLAPIPPVVFSPYLVAIMPSFRSASAAPLRYAAVTSAPRQLITRPSRHSAGGRGVGSPPKISGQKGINVLLSASFRTFSQGLEQPS